MTSCLYSCTTSSFHSKRNEFAPKSVKQTQWNLEMYFKEFVFLFVLRFYCLIKQMESFKGGQFI